MEQIKCFADDRLINGCIYCSGFDDTRDHVPSKVFLDPPYPENLPVVGACRKCNISFSEDEEYVACLIESIISGTTNPKHIRRSKVSNIFNRSPKLRDRIESVRYIKNEQTHFGIEVNRIENVLLKLARGHAAYELAQLTQRKPTLFQYAPLHSLDEEKLEEFESCHVTESFGEVGSRSIQRILVTQISLQSTTGEKTSHTLLINDWIEVQEGRYRYLAIEDYYGIKIKIVLSEFLACEVVWDFDC